MSGTRPAASMAAASNTGVPLSDGGDYRLL